MGVALLVGASSCASLPPAAPENALDLNVQVLSRSSCSDPTFSYVEIVSALTSVKNNGQQPLFLTRGGAYGVEIAASEQDLISGRTLYRFGVEAGETEAGASTHLLRPGEALADVRAARIAVRGVESQAADAVPPGSYAVRFEESYFIRPQDASAGGGQPVRLFSQPIRLELIASPQLRECGGAVGP